MNQTVLFKVPGRASRRPVVVLEGISFDYTKFSTPISVRISRALSRTWHRVLCSCTPRNIVRALFSAKVSAVVAVAVVAAMWWHNIVIDDTVAAQEAVGFDCLLGMPWGIVWAIRATFMPMPEEGGEE